MAREPASSWIYVGGRFGENAHTVNEEIKALIESLRRGQHEDPTEKIGLLGAALREHAAPVELLLSLLRAPQIPLRVAAVEGCLGREEAEITLEVASLAGDSESKVREKVPGILASSSEPEAIAALMRLARDPAEEVRLATLKATCGNAGFFDAHRVLMEGDSSWTLRLAAANSLAAMESEAIAQPLMLALGSDSDPDVARRCAEALENLLATARERFEALFPTDIAILSKADQSLKGLGAERFKNLQAWISVRTATTVDPRALGGYGTDLTALAEQGTLSRGHCLREQCDSLVKLVRRDRWRSLALLGSAGVGKSALVHELVYELMKPENGGWRVLRITPSDFLAGTRYIGEWETKVKELIELVKKPRRVLIYVPNLADLSTTGSWAKSDSSVATALAPYLEEGSLMLLGESTPEQFERGLGRVPSLQRLFDRVLLPESSPEHTHDILVALRDEQHAAVPDDVLRHLQETASQFLGHISRPGNAVGLFRSVSQTAKELGRPALPRDILDSLSRSTGIPADLLDDTLPLNQAELKAFFEQRIIGQPEAVEAVVDLVTLIKAGLTDPQKPFGVMLFVGPTGVGKTELARALAEFIFGNSNRLLRLDMSEFASADGFVRLIGGPNEDGMLTDAVRQRPFSVVLLDEIEKSHVNVFDLCLQIFDAGRLTDGRGRTVDFRRTIVILTSNVGASAPTPVLGFQAGAEIAPAEADKDRTFRELTRFFRPEFLNRLDRIVQFRPLSLEVAEQIARREIELVLRRSGIRRRDLAVEVAPAVLSLLVREGYSPHFGARPLKRTVERRVLLPLARAIASGGVEPRTILHLTATGDRVEVGLTPPPRVTPEQPMIPPPQVSFRSRCTDLLGQWTALEPQVQPLTERKSQLLRETQAPGFYKDGAKRDATFDEIHKLDQFLSLRDGLGKALRGLLDRLEFHPPSANEEPSVRDRLEELGAELDQLRSIAVSKDAGDLGDALLCISLVERRGEGTAAVEKLAEMYRAFAERRRMSVEVLGEFIAEKQDRAWIAVCGLGAFALLKQEAGLHHIDCRARERERRTGHEVFREHRDTVRVEVLRLAADPDKSLVQTAKSKLVILKPAHTRLIEKADLRVSLFHEPTLRSLELWTVGPRNAALHRSLLILQTLLRPDGSVPEADAVVRHYEIGIAPRIKDTRSGRSTTRIDRVFKGHLDALLAIEPLRGA